MLNCERGSTTARHRYKRQCVTKQCPMTRNVYVTTGNDFPGNYYQGLLNDRYHEGNALSTTSHIADYSRIVSAETHAVCMLKQFSPVNLSAYSEYFKWIKIMDKNNVGSIGGIINSKVSQYNTFQNIKNIKLKI